MPFYWVKLWVVASVSCFTRSGLSPNSVSNWVIASVKPCFWLESGSVPTGLGLVFGLATRLSTDHFKLTTSQTGYPDPVDFKAKN